MLCTPVATLAPPPPLHTCCQSPAHMPGPAHQGSPSNGESALVNSSLIQPTGDLPAIMCRVGGIWTYAIPCTPLHVVCRLHTCCKSPGVVTGPIHQMSRLKRTDAEVKVTCHRTWGHGCHHVQVSATKIPCHAHGHYLPPTHTCCAGHQRACQLCSATLTSQALERIEKNKGQQAALVTWLPSCARLVAA